MRPGDRLVCVFVQEFPVGAQFTDWPLHVTVVPWFRSDESIANLTNEFRQALSGTDTFPVYIEGVDQFGFKRQKTVAVVGKSTPFIAIEQKVRAVLHAHRAWLADESTKRKRTYRPHVTDQKHDSLRPGDHFTCHSLAIVEQKGAYKEVAASVKLKYGQETA